MLFYPFKRRGLAAEYPALGFKHLVTVLFNLANLLHHAYAIGFILTAKSNPNFKVFTLLPTPDHSPLYFKG